MKPGALLIGGLLLAASQTASATCTHGPRTTIEVLDPLTASACGVLHPEASLAETRPLAVTGRVEMCCHGRGETKPPPCELASLKPANLRVQDAAGREVEGTWTKRGDTCGEHDVLTFDGTLAPGTYSILLGERSRSLIVSSRKSGRR